MNDLRTAAQQALEALEFLSLDFFMLDPISPGREAGTKAIIALKTVLSTTREHITDGSPCWCNPELNYVDPDTGAKVWVHKEPQ